PQLDTVFLARSHDAAFFRMPRAPPTVGGNPSGRGGGKRARHATAGTAGPCPEYETAEAGETPGHHVVCMPGQGDLQVLDSVTVQARSTSGPSARSKSVCGPTCAGVVRG